MAKIISPWTNYGTTMGEGSHSYLNEYFDILSNERRRIAIRILGELNEVTVSQLSEEVASVEYGKNPEKLTSDERKRVYTSMSQVHVPKLEQCGVVRYNQRGIQPTDKNEELVRYLRGLEGYDRTLWWMFGFAASSMVLATAASVLFFWVGATKLGNVIPVAIGFVMATAIVGFCVAWATQTVEGFDITRAFSGTRSD